MSDGRICGSRLTSMTRGRDKATSPRRGRDGPERHEAAEIHRGLVDGVPSRVALDRVKGLDVKVGEPASRASEHACVQAGERMVHGLWRTTSACRSSSDHAPV